MKTAFDSAAISYDEAFTHTPIGRLQRRRVWRYMRKVLAPYEQARILELNCGTGEDACFFAEMGHEVLATDISEEMLRVTEQKAAALQLERVKTPAPGSGSAPAGISREIRFDFFKLWRAELPFGRSG